MGKMFEDAKFGDFYVTRNKRKAVFLARSKKICQLYIDGMEGSHFYFSTGGYSLSGKEHPLDIIGKCEINEEEINAEAEKRYPVIQGSVLTRYEATEVFKEGVQWAMENNFKVH